MTTIKTPIRYRRKAKILSESGCLSILLDSATLAAIRSVRSVRFMPLNFKVVRFDR